MKKVSEAATKEQVKLGPSILTTHHHADHAGGNLEYIKLFSDKEKSEVSKADIQQGEVKVYGGSKKCDGWNSIVRLDF